MCHINSSTVHDEAQMPFGGVKDSGIGRDIEKGKVGFKQLEAYMLKQGDSAPNTSGRQEFLENLINEFI